jgi:pimeloyl-ACP methyl ester carboxylesterase
MIADTMDVAGARLYFEVRGQGPLVVLAGAPMDAAAFAPLADLLATDHTVLTTDPRGINRSPLDDPEEDSTPELRAEDLARLITRVDAGPAVALGSSGGAVSALALAQARPDLVRTVIAHEPPLVRLVEDRDELLKGTDEMIATHAAGDTLGTWRLFMAQANIDMPDGMLEMIFGGERDPQALADERRWFAHELRKTVGWRIDADGLRAADVMIGIGEDSAGELCDRTSRVLAGILGREPVMFPGGHTGMVDEPARFAERMREVLAAHV